MVADNSATSITDYLNAALEAAYGASKCAEDAVHRLYCIADDGLLHEVRVKADSVAHAARLLCAAIENAQLIDHDSALAHIARPRCAIRLHK